MKSCRIILILSAFCVAILSCASCVVSSPSTVYDPPPDISLPTLANIQEIIQSTIVIINLHEEGFGFSSGTGIYLGDITDDGISQHHILTAYHVIVHENDENKTSEKLLIRTINEQAYAGKILYTNIDIDCAIVEINNPLALPYATPIVLSDKNPEYAESTYTIGHPNGVEWVYSQGYVMNPDVIFRAMSKEKFNGFISSCFVDFGSSGSGIYNSDTNQCIGLVSVKIGTSNHAGCVTSSLILDWLNEEKQKQLENENE